MVELERYPNETDEEFAARQQEAEAQAAEGAPVVGPQALLDEHVYPTHATTDPRATHVAMTEAEELAAAETPPEEPPPDTETGGLGRNANP
jgi:hypothetical protein